MGEGKLRRTHAMGHAIILLTYPPFDPKGDTCLVYHVSAGTTSAKQRRRDEGVLRSERSLIRSEQVFRQHVSLPDTGNLHRGKEVN